MTVDASKVPREVVRTIVAVSAHKEDNFRRVGGWHFRLPSRRYLTTCHGRRSALCRTRALVTPDCHLFIIGACDFSQHPLTWPVQCSLGRAICGPGVPRNVAGLGHCGSPSRGACERVPRTPGCCERPGNPGRGYNFSKRNKLTLIELG